MSLYRCYFSSKAGEQTGITSIAVGTDAGTSQVTLCVPWQNRAIQRLEAWDGPDPGFCLSGYDRSRIERQYFPKSMA
jgi:hypothetical protein